MGVSNNQDRYALSYTVWACTLAIFVVSLEELELLYDSGTLLLLGLPILGVVLIIAILWFVSALSKHVWHRRWRRVASIVAAPFLAVGFCVALLQVGIDPTWVRFQFSKHAYLQEVERQKSAGNSSPFIRWPWGMRGLAVSVSYNYTLIYDESDKIATPAYQDLRSRCDDCLVYEKSMRPIEGHFYLEVENVQ